VTLIAGPNRTLHLVDPADAADPARLRESIVRLTRSLVRTASQGDVDSPSRVLARVADWLRTSAGLEPVTLQAARKDGGRAARPVGVVTALGAAGDRRPALCLAACADTALIGDPRRWDYDPLSGHVHEGWLYGRGAADSKTGLAIFCHLLRDLAPIARAADMNLVLLADGDEHSGAFGGVRALLDAYPTIRSMYIGYPGCDSIRIGARGFYRAEIAVRGRMVHSGASRDKGLNAAVLGSDLAVRIADAALPDDAREPFTMGPRIEVTGIRAGVGYSVVPDLCRINVDMRLTPDFRATQARGLLERIVREFEEDRPGLPRVEIDDGETWPDYHLEAGEPLVRGLKTGAERAFGRPVPLRVSGPSNVGNFLASRGIAATCGFGVDYENMHAPNERVRIDTILPVYRAYRDAVLDVIGVDRTARPD